MPDLAEAKKLRLAVADLSSRAEAVLNTWSTQLVDRTKPRRAAKPNTAADRIVAEEKLRQQLGEIENEMGVVQREYDAQSATARFWEERAMVAMRHSDDVSAQEALQAHEQHVEALHELTSELTVLRALAKSCREALGLAHERTT